MRSEMETLLLDAHKKNDLAVAIVKGSDFYGPRVRTSNMGERVFPNLLQGKAASVIGDPTQPHSYTYIRDFARLMALVADTSQAAGQVWHVPSAETLSTTGFIQRAADAAGTQAKISAIPKGLLTLLSVFVPILRELKEVAYQFEQPFIVDGSKAAGQLGFTPIPLDQALQDTLDWYRTQA